MGRDDVETLKSIADCPCTTCELAQRCFEGGEISPENCEKLTKWLMRLSGLK